jgi:alpha-L-fucosidase
MWDSKYTDYKITGSDCPFSSHKYSDVCKHLFDAMREKGLAIFPYFSKADWNVPSYWAEDGKYDNTTRHHNYNVKENPELWEEFVQFTHNQILELATNYGRIDTIWLDAGWVNRNDGEDIRIEELIEKARNIQPWLISADRTCGGICENYVTPEQTIPEKPMNIPWESCITIGNSFSYRFDDDYKSVFYLVHLLIDIVAKGGNLALNVGPQPDGRFPKDAIDRIKGLGEFLNVYGDSIYGTRVCAPYRTGNYAFTKNGNKVFAFYMYEDETHENMDKYVIPYTEKVSKVTLMKTGKELDFTVTDSGIEVMVYEDTQNDIATVFVLE